MIVLLIIIASLLVMILTLVISVRMQINDLKSEVMKKIDERYLDTRYKIVDEHCDLTKLILAVDRNINILTKPVEDLVAETARKLFTEANKKEV